MTTKVSFLTLGCKVNQIESDAMARLFQNAGYEIVAFSDAADVCVINTCAVTQTSEQKSRKLIRRARRLNPTAVIAVVGCYSQIAPENVASIEGVDVIIGTKDRKKIVEYVEAALKEKSAAQVPPETAYGSSAPLERGARLGIANARTYQEYEEIDDGFPSVRRRTRAFMKIQDGCDNFCTYCIIPYTRGKSRSRPLANIAAEAKKLAAEGYREIVLNGIHLGNYGKDFTPLLSLADAVEAVLAEPRFLRVRLGSVESIEIGDRLIDLLKTEPRLAPHLHLPLQSGSDAVLKRMGRPYSVAEFTELIAKIRAAVPHIAITTDIIAGFPGETETMFQETLATAEKLQFAHIHTFPYSSRPGTPAAAMDGQIDENEKKSRVHRLEKISSATAAAFQQKLIGTATAVIVEQIRRRADGRLVGDGLTGNYVRIYFDAENLKSGEIIEVTPTEFYEDGLWGNL